MTYFNWKFLAVLLLFAACRKEDDPIADERGQLESITEKRYTPSDSFTVWSTFNRESKLILEQNSLGSSTQVFNGIGEVPNGWTNFQLRQFNESNMLISESLFKNSGGRKGLMWADTLIYSGSRVSQKLLHNHYLYPDGAVLSFPKPLWITKTSYTYNIENRVATMTDSIFIAHDIPKGSVVIVSTPEKFVFLNRTTLTYSAKGELSEQAVTSTLSSVDYSNGSSAFAVSNPIPKLPGKTSFRYEYDDQNRLTSKIATFVDSRDGKVYNSTFSYSYYPN